MQEKSKQQHFSITCQLPSGKTKTVEVKASSLDVAKRRALKRVPSAIGARKAKAEEVADA